jgi:hypothetical protein
VSAPAKIRASRPYAGRGVSELRGPRSSIRLAGPDDATFLPVPRDAHAALLARFRAVNGPEGTQAFPNLRARDVRAFANLVTLALRNDLPAIDPRDAAVLWDKWRQAVDDVREHLRRVRDHDATNETSPDVWNASIVLDHRGWDVIENLTIALARPGDVFQAYCPWRSEWATFERLHPEAV